MKADFAYIDEVVERGVVGSMTVPKRADVEAARKVAERIVAGFPVYDESAERRHLDYLMQQRKNSFEAYMANRCRLADSLEDVGVTPLAIVPDRVWRGICAGAGLIRLRPDPLGAILISNEWRQSLKAKFDRKWWSDKKIIRAAAAEAQLIADTNWALALQYLFPTGESYDAERYTYHRTYTTRVILPEPPDGVKDILCKVAGLKPRVAAVPEAIRFSQSISEIFFAQEAEDRRREEEARRDPIVYIEQSPVDGVAIDSGAVAIVAQFGDFPVEREVVDKVVALDGKLPENASEAQRLIASFNLN